MANETESRRWGHVVLTHAQWEELRPLVKERNIKYEPSGYYEDVYVSVYANKAEESYINGCLYVITAH